MISPDIRPLFGVLCGFMLLGTSLYGCQRQVEPKPVFPDAEPLAHRHRNHSMTESPDHQLRVFAAQKGDVTDLMVSKRIDKDRWTTPIILDLPRRETNTSPRFFPDGALYYSSDAPHPARPGRKDLNIWRVDMDADMAGVPTVLPDAINSGSHEDSFAPLGKDRAVFSSTTLGGVGGFDLYLAEKQNGEWKTRPFPHNTAMADSHPVTTHDGKTLIWYAHLPADAVYGVVDLFVSHLEEGGWSAPQNLGPRINTAGVDYGAGISSDGKTLFVSRDGVLLETGLEAAIAHAGFVAPE